jgi:hypothetical protein
MLVHIVVVNHRILLRWYIDMYRTYKNRMEMNKDNQHHNMPEYYLEYMHHKNSDMFLNMFDHFDMVQRL